MPRIYVSARGHTVDFDAVMIKQKLAQAPMDVEVARRKNFIDSKEEKVKRPAPPPLIQDAAPAEPVATDVLDQEPEPVANLTRVEAPVPQLPARKK